jgi:hypothetical protein
MVLKHITSTGLAILLTTLIACGSGSSKQTAQPNNSTVDLPVNIPNNSGCTDYKIIIYGNSHSAQLGRLLDTIITSQLPNKSVNTATVSGRFLDEIVAVSGNLKKLKEEKWSHAIFQGQKYSQSGLSTYPTSAINSNS